MAEERTILLKVELDVNQLESNAKAAEDKLKELVPTMKAIREEQGQHSKAYKEAQLEVKKYNKILTDSVKALQANEAATEEATGSLQEMRDQLAAAKVSYKDLSQEVRNSPVGEKMAKDMNTLKSAINEVEEGFGTFTGSVGNYKKAIREVQGENTSLTDTFEDVYGDGAKPLTARLGELEDRMYEMVLSGEAGSKAFKELQVEAGTLRKAVIQTDAAVDQLAESGGALGAGLQLAEGVVSGYQAATGVMALLGNENEKLLEVLTKLEAAQAVLNSLEAAKMALQKNSIRFTQMQAGAQRLLNKAIGEGSKASKIFRGALLATGIGVIIFAVTELIANFDKLKSMFGSVNSQQKLNNETMHAANEAIAAEISAADKLSRTLNDENVTREEKRKAVKALQEQYPTLLGNIDAEKTSIEDVNKALNLNIKLARLKAQSDAVAELRAEKFKDILNEQTDAMTGQNVGYADILEAQLANFEISDLWGAKMFDNKKIQEDATEARKLANADTKETIKGMNKEIDALDKLDESILEQIKSLEELGASDEDYKKKQDALKKSIDARRKAEEEALKKTIELAKQLRELQTKNVDLSLKNERKVLEAHYAFIESMAGDNAAQILEINRQKNADLVALEEKEEAAAKAKIEQKYNLEIAAATKAAQEIAKVRGLELEEVAGHTERLAELEEAKQAELEAIRLDYVNARVQRETNQINNEAKFNEERVDLSKDAAQEIKLIEGELALALAKTPEAQHKAWKDLQDQRVKDVEATRDRLVLNEQLTQEERVRIVKQAELDITNIKKESYESEKQLNEQRKGDQIAIVTSALSSAQQMSDSIFQIVQNQLTEQLNLIAENFEESSTLLDEQLAAGLISQAEYNAQSSALEAEYKAKEERLKREQFKKQKAAQIISATIATAVGVVNALAAPPPLSFVMAAIAGALGAAQIGIIASQPTPTFEKGGGVPLKSGIFGGNLHKNGGTQGAFSDGTRVEVEKDEAFFILNRRATGAIAQLSNHNQKHGGAPMMARGGALKFEAGGSFATRVSSPVEDRFSQQNAVIQAAKAMPAPIVLVEDINGAQDNLATVQSAAEF